MKRQRRSILLEAILWVIAEIILNSAGLDTLADYSEFLINQKSTVMLIRTASVAN